MSDGPEGSSVNEADSEMAALLAATEDRFGAEAEGELAWSYDATAAVLTA